MRVLYVGFGCHSNRTATTRSEQSATGAPEPNERNGEATQLAVRAQRAQRRSARRAPRASGASPTSTIACSGASSGASRRGPAGDPRVGAQPPSHGSGVAQEVARRAPALPERLAEPAVDAPGPLVQLDTPAERERDAEHPVLAAVRVGIPAAVTNGRGAHDRRARGGEQRPDGVTDGEQARAARQPGVQRGGQRWRTRGSSSTIAGATATSRGSDAIRSRRNRACRAASGRRRPRRARTACRPARARDCARRRPSASGARARTRRRRAAGSGSSEALSTTTIRAARSWSRRLAIACRSGAPA